MHASARDCQAQVQSPRCGGGKATRTTPDPRRPCQARPSAGRSTQHTRRGHSRRGLRCLNGQCWHNRPGAERGYKPELLSRASPWRHGHMRAGNGGGAAAMAMRTGKSAALRRLDVTFAGLLRTARSACSCFGLNVVFGACVVNVDRAHALLALSAVATRRPGRLLVPFLMRLPRRNCSAKEA
jgi:hypothetical protein